MNLNSILIGSDDPQRLVDYYTRLFGAPGMAEGGYSGWQLGSGWLTIGPHSEVHGPNEQPGRLIWNLETPDVRAEFERLVTAGATVVREPYGFDGDENGLIATLADPDGNYFQLMSPG
jgi:predicted enzyme related to lactoylglutathione lyase